MKAIWQRKREGKKEKGKKEKREESLLNAGPLYFWGLNFIYGVIKKDGLNFVRLYFLNYTRYVNDLPNI
jgi:hypothetical protein